MSGKRWEFWMKEFLNMNKSNVFSRCSTALKESRGARLQRNVEMITQTLEYEKREANYLDEQLKLLQFEMGSLKKPSPKVVLGLKASISVQEKKLELEKNILNNAKYKNKQLREKINEYRLDKFAYKQSLLSALDTLDKTSKAADEQTEEINRTQESDISQQEKILMIRSRSENQKYRYHGKITALAELLRNQEKNNEKAFEERNMYSQSVEIITILKKLVKESQKTTLGKKKEIEQYIRHINTLMHGFEQIKKIMGIGKIDEIVTSCIKSEEQGHAILFYLNNLNSEIDLLEETLKTNNSRISMITGYKTEGEASIVQHLKDNEEKYFALIEKKEAKKKILDEITVALEELLPIIKNLYSRLKSMNFPSEFNDSVEMSAIEKLNHENTKNLLGQSEEFINFLLQIIGSQTQNSLCVPEKILKKVRSASSQKAKLLELLHDKDLYDEADYEDLKVPMALTEMKQKALNIFERRRSQFKEKPSELEIPPSRGTNYRATREFL